MDQDQLKNHRKAQNIARATIEYLKSSIIKSGVSEREIKDAAERFMKEKGADSFWYYDIGAFVLIGNRTKDSFSGKSYSSLSSTKAYRIDLVTVDLSPEVEGCWGDYARSFVIDHDKVLGEEDIGEINYGSISRGIYVEKKLHQKLQEIAEPDMRFEELFLIMNEEIKKLGFKNLDFKGNLGHSIADTLDGRIYIEKGNDAKLGDVELFTFEPHIQAEGGMLGYKREDIYYFDGGKLKEL